MGGHATLSPSSAKRWIACPGSVRAQEGLEESRSEFAALGTAAHELASNALEAKDRDAWKYKGLEFDGGDEDTGPWMFIADDDMCYAVQVYLDEVWACYDGLEGAEMAVETRVRVPGRGDDIWGTLDCRVSQPFGELHVFDYKHGQGVVVEVERNEQLMLYALGTVHEEGRGEHDEVTIHIVQPRARHSDGKHRSWAISEDELFQWFEEEVEPAAAMALGESVGTLPGDHPRPGPSLAAGDHCKFCRAAATCAALNDEVQRVTALDFADPPEDYLEDTVKTIGDDKAYDLAQSLKAVPMIDAFVKAVETEALRRLEVNEEVPGFKLVRKKSNRAWLDAGAALKRLTKKRSVKKSDVMTEPALKTPAQVEKIKAIGKALVAELCHKPLGGFTVVSDSDPRDAVDPAEELAAGAAADFTEE